MLHKVTNAVACIAFACLVSVFALAEWNLSTHNPAEPTDHQHSTKRANEQNRSQPNEGLWDWLAHDAAGFFTLWLVIIGGAQLALFYVQLKLIRESLIDAQQAADAATKGAKAAEGAAEAAGKQAKIAEESFAKLERFTRGGEEYNYIR
jgi:hypothetical protein